ncbi:hypothetical protein MELA_00965 [Candidatus Methylomirabilis lanthanidiphila]|uniref:Uncharacterized protein n=1 Tax=Candidatus Methylomirabilis lanthanidiphila TaxID=2211376 RepID=A0A564ZIX5_9BACT|nr:hypothetical protein MELA_00965 [Candidatus Methylomirabilis lanthanidiphila]
MTANRTTKGMSAPLGATIHPGGVNFRMLLMGVEVRRTQRGNNNA